MDEIEKIKIYNKYELQKASNKDCKHFNETPQFLID